VPSSVVSSVVVEDGDEEEVVKSISSPATDSLANEPATNVTPVMVTVVAAVSPAVEILVKSSSESSTSSDSAMA
jgi:hypothetical protein